MNVDAKSLKSLMEPRSIAVIGASSDSTRIGGRPIEYLKRAGFAGPIYPVNPSRSEIQGLAAYPSIAAVPGLVDCAIVAVGAEQVEQTVKDCGLKGVGSVVVFSSGFAETGDNGRQAQTRLMELGRQSGTRILGPNVVGLYNAVNRSFVTFSGAASPVIDLPPSRISVVSQSGGYAGYLLGVGEDQGVRFGKWVSTGNEADVDVSEVIGYYAEDSETDVILAYVEGIQSGQRFARGLDQARRAGKPVIVLKVGRTEKGGAAAASHTASIAGSDSVFDAVCRRYGARRAANAAEMLDFAYAASKIRRLSGRRLSLVTVSGGVGVEMADLAADHGFEVPDTPADAQAQLRILVPFCSPTNPVDVTAQITNDPSLLGKSLNILFRTGLYDTVVVFLGHAAAFPALAEPFAVAIESVRSQYPQKALLLIALGDKSLLQRYEAAGCIVFRDPARAIRALAALSMVATDCHADSAPSIPASGSDCPTRPLNESDSKSILKVAGICVPEDRIVRTVDEAVRQADSLGYPVALKILAASIPHKSDIGGVALNVRDAASVRKLAERMLIIRDATGQPVEGLLVTPMITGGVECILGLSTDPVFGPFVMFGLGGTSVELLKDVAIRIAPLNRHGALEMIREVKSFPLLDGYRGSAKADLEALVSALVALSGLPWSSVSGIASMEVNPMRVMAVGKGVVALDATATQTVDQKAS